MNTMQTPPQKNRLASEPSPYLQQHAANPVHWYPWGDDAFTQARQQNKPVFLSIGYATCHWCHVMAHESFEDNDVAKILNDTFICIKVDREERPDLDALYMNICTMLTGSGGWPLTILMTPEKKPFFAATYLPKTSRFGLIGIIDLCSQIHHLWHTQKEKLLASADHITSLLTVPASSNQNHPPLTLQVLDTAYQHLVASFDEHYGGFSPTQKFPTPHTLLFLLRYWNRTKNSYALTMVERTLQHMRYGGIFDQIGYGFHRYATDRQWNIPHFEKMLYDQALLVLAYTEAYQITGNPLYRQTTQEIITYVLRDMTSPDGGFYTAQDADSEGEEGKYYTWTCEEVRQILSPDDYRIFTTLFDNEKNDDDHAQIQKRPKRAILFHHRPFDESAQLLCLEEEHLRTTLQNITATLYHCRTKRIPPLKDDKILSDWNGLMIAALAKAGTVLYDKTYINAAENAAVFLQKTMIKKTGQILHRFRNDQAGIIGFADDYAFTIWGFIELYQATFDITFLRTALTLHRYYQQHFWDDTDKGFFFSETSDAPLPRIKEWYDGAIPSANSVSAMNLLKLSRLTGDTTYEEIADALFRSIGSVVTDSPTGYTFLLTGVDFIFGPTKEILVIGEKDADDTQHILTEIYHTYLPNSVVVLLSPTAGPSASKKIFPFVGSFPQKDNKATVYVCKKYHCEQPTTSVQDLRRLLE
jgi:uncharacterized protein YyaL (SSP411 family)